MTIWKMRVHAGHRLHYSIMSNRSHGTTRHTQYRGQVIGRSTHTHAHTNVTEPHFDINSSNCLGSQKVMYNIDLI